MRFIKDSTKVFLSQLICLLCGFVSSVIVARAIGASGKGIYELVKIITWLGSIFIGFGVEEATIYYVSKYPEKREAILSNIIFFTIISGAIFSILLAYNSQWFITHPLPNLDKFFFILAVACIPAFTLSRCITAFFQGMREFNFYLISHIVFSINLLICSIFAFKGVTFAIIGLTCVFFSSSIVNLILLMSKVKLRTLPDFKLLLKILSYGIRAQIGILIRFVNLRADNFILNYYAGTSAVGIYSVSVALAEALWKIPSAFATVLLPRIASFSNEKIKEYTERTMSITTLLVIGGIIVLFLLGKPLIRLLWGKSFSLSYIPMLWLFPGILSLSISKICSSVFHGKGKPEYGSLLSIISCVIMLPLDFILIPKYNVVGASIATSISYGVSGIVALLLLFRLIKGVEFKKLFSLRINYHEILSFLKLK